MFVSDWTRLNEYFNSTKEEPIINLMLEVTNVSSLSRRILPYDDNYKSDNSIFLRNVFYNHVNWMDTKMGLSYWYKNFTVNSKK